jgi:hypothetical protein
MIAHKTRYIITFFISAALCITTTHTMIKKFKKQPKNKHSYTIGEVLLLQKNKHTPIAITEDEAHFSSSISIENALKNTETYHRFPIGIDIPNKDIQFFQKIIHQPAHYGNGETFPDKKYFKALTIAEQLNAPLLYAELLIARLPSDVSHKIAQKYLRLHNMPEMFCNIIHHHQIMIILATKPHILSDSNSQRLLQQRQKIKEKYLQWSNELDMDINEMIRSATLTQSVLLSMITNNRKINRIVMKIGMHTPGYNAFMAMTEDQLDFMCEYFPITLEQKATKSGCWATESFNITV